MMLVADGGLTAAAWVGFAATLELRAAGVALESTVECGWAAGGLPELRTTGGLVTTEGVGAAAAAEFESTRLVCAGGWRVARSVRRRLPSSIPTGLAALKVNPKAQLNPMMASNCKAVAGEKTFAEPATWFDAGAAAAFRDAAGVRRGLRCWLIAV